MSRSSSTPTRWRAGPPERSTPQQVLALARDGFQKGDLPSDCHPAVQRRRCHGEDSAGNPPSHVHGPGEEHGGHADDQARSLHGPPWSAGHVHLHSCARDTACSVASSSNSRTTAFGGAPVAKPRLPGKGSTGTWETTPAVASLGATTMWPCSKNEMRGTLNSLPALGSSWSPASLREEPRTYSAPPR